MLNKSYTDRLQYYMEGVRRGAQQQQENTTKALGKQKTDLRVQAVHNKADRKVGKVSKE